jgi:hypothetical protein
MDGAYDDLQLTATGLRLDFAVLNMFRIRLPVVTQLSEVKPMNEKQVA